MPFDIFDEALLNSLGRKQPIRVVSDWRLDVDAGRAASGPGKNIQLGRLRAALGQNTLGAAWSFAMLAGAGPLKVQVTHQPNQKDPSDPYVKVKSVSPVA